MRSGDQEVAVGDHACDDAVVADARNDVVQLGMSSGSPPEIVMMLVPRRARWSMRLKHLVDRERAWSTSSYSLQ